MHNGIVENECGFRLQRPLYVKSIVTKSHCNLLEIWQGFNKFLKFIVSFKMFNNDLLIVKQVSLKYTGMYCISPKSGL